MATCTYAFTNAAGERQVITGQAAFKAFLADGGLAQLTGKAAPGVTLSRARQTESPEFKKWFGDSTIVNDDGTPKLMYHGTARDIRTFRAKQAGAIFVTENPTFAEDFSEMSKDWMIEHYEEELTRDQLQTAYKNAEEKIREKFADDAEKADLLVHRMRTGELMNPIARSEFSKAIADQLETGPNVMQVYVRAEKPFDYENPEHVAAVVEELNKSTDQWGQKRGDRAANFIKTGNWETIEKPTTQSAIKAAGFDGFYVKEARQKNLAVYSSNQIKSATGNVGTYDITNPDITQSKQRIVGESKRSYTPEQLAMFKNTGRTVETPTLKERITELRKDLGKKLAQGIVDQFRPLRDLGGKAYALARLSKGSAGAFEAFLRHGKLSIVDGVYDGDMTGGFVERVGVPLHGELEDFMWWVASNRADRLAAEDRENLFTAEDIRAGKSLADGETEFDYTMQHGPDAGKVTRNREKIYRDALKTFDEFNKNAMDMAAQSGLIDQESRKYWENEFYVPFYRVSDEDGAFVGAKMGNSLVRQRAFKQLKGGTNKLNSDLLANTLQNWGHLIDAAAKNRAAKETLEAAEKLGIAIEANEETVRAMGKSIGKSGNTVWFMDGGKERYFLVDDPMLMSAITSLEFSGLRGPVMTALSKPKEWLTIGVTASPAFKIRNLVRDSVQAVATAPLSYNLAKNIRTGIEASSRTSQTYVSALASGGLIRFGTMLEGKQSDRVRQLVRSGVKDSTILDSDSKVQAMYDRYLEPAIEAYNELGNRGEEINRASLYKQLIDQNVDKATAALMARDMMDFSMQGSWTSVRFLTQVVPFMNARLQGLYKLGRSAEEDPKRFAVVLAAVALASITLMAAYQDDDDWKKREDWDRNNFWWFKVGGVAFRIPKPFEIGAMGTLAERGLEYFINDEMTGKRLRQNVSSLILNSLSMNPVPQAVKPITDIYANKDSFTGRPIESLGMERLRPEYRFTQGTSMVSRGLSTATGGALSPVQYDHILKGYFGWLGSFVVGGADMMLRPLTGQAARPTADYWKMATQGIAQEVDSGSSRYVTQMYEQAKELEQSYGTYRMLLKQGRTEEAKEFFQANREDLVMYRSVEKVKSTEAKYNEMIRIIERSSMPPDEKKEKIRDIQQRKDKIARLVAPGLR